MPCCRRRLHHRSRLDTVLVPPDGRREGLGRVKPNATVGKQGFFAHVSLAVAADGSRRPLGLAALKTWVRGPEPSGIEYQRSEQQIRDASTRLDGQRHAIHVMDREADDYQMFDALIHDKHRFVARALADRNVETEAGDTKYRALLRTQPATIEREVPLTSRRRKGNPHKNKTHPPRTARTARLMFAATYRARWVIEEYFHAIKTGCRFQERQLEDYEGLVNLLATFAPIAYHLLLLRSEARRVPEAAARTVLSDEQLVVLRVLGRVKLSAQPTLGGHIKYNGDPGWGTPAYGFEELQSLTAGWVAAKLQARRDQ